MKKAYSINEDGTSDPMENVHCANEEAELQLILEKNLQLIPGDQINPEDPRRWICVKRELPIEDPTNGEMRWSLDFLLLDQSGVPTFVECKRFLDTRSRREVIGQMFDYAANGIAYFSRERIFDYLSEQAQKQSTDVEGLLMDLDPDSGDSVEAYLEMVSNNIEEGQVRMIFFMEESSYELRSIVEFLNSQLQRTEVLIVEAKQFQKDGFRFVVPSLWGYTEKARRIKKSTTVSGTSSGRRKWNLSLFYEALSEKRTEEEFEAIKDLYDRIKAFGVFKVRWGTGTGDGSFNVIAEDICSRSFLNVTTNGVLSFPLLWLSEDGKEVQLRDFIFGYLNSETSIEIKEEQKQKWVKFENWLPEREKIVRMIEEIIKKFDLGDWHGGSGPEKG